MAGFFCASQRKTFKYEAINYAIRGVTISQPITVYSLPNCVQCNATYRTLDRMGVEYEKVDLLEAPEKAQELKDRGFAQAPIVETESATWSGFQPALLANL